MSIIFWCPDAPVRQVNIGCDEEPCWISKSVLPEVNVSSANLSAIQDLVPRFNDDCGTISLEEMPQLRQTIIKVLSGHFNVSEDPITVYKTSAAEIDGINTIRRAVNYHFGGVSTERITKILNDILNLLAEAQKNNYTVSWG